MYKIYSTRYIFTEISAGVREATVELQANYKPSKINTLCIRRESIIQVICFQTANCLLSFAWKFHIMTNVCNSGIFDATWPITMKNAFRGNPNMSIADVEAQVWVPAFKHCQNLLEQLASQSMTLADVDKHFQHYRGHELERELKCLFDGVNQCLSQEQRHDKWIRHTVIRIEDYRKLRGYCEAANSFLKLKQSLKLTKGDFTAVERISREVSLFQIPLSLLVIQGCPVYTCTCIYIGVFFNERPNSGQHY